MKPAINLSTLKEYGKYLGIGAVGYMPTERLDQYLIYEEEKRSRLLCGDISLIGEKEWSMKPDLVLNGAKGFVVALFPNRLEEVKSLASNSVNLSDATNFQDYHKTLKDTLAKLSEFMQLQWHANTHILVDTHPFPERFIAKEAGLGCIGKNSYLLNETYGSATYIGLILTDVTGEAVGLTEDLCGSCNICVEACPNQALVEGRYVNDHRCISYLTQKKHLNRWDMNHMHKSLYGCDICSRACPYTKAYINSNENLNKTEDLIALETLLQEDGTYTKDMSLENQIKIDTLLSLNNKTFSATIGKTSAGWIGKKRLQRNALVALQYCELSYQHYCLTIIEADQRDEIVKIKAYINEKLQESL